MASAELIIFFLIQKKHQDVVFTVVLRLLLPVAAICACLPLLVNACSHGVLWSIRSESQSSQTHFPPPLGFLFTHILWLWLWSSSLLTASCHA